MGGWNSGRRAHRITIEGCRSLSLDVLDIMRPVVAAMRRNATVEPFTLRPRVLSWSRSGEPYAEIEYTLTVFPEAGTGALRLRHGDVHDYGHRAQDYSVPLDTTRPPFGGLQWWFHCPITGRRCRKLFLPNGARTFACRQAYGLHYRSQAEGAVERARRRIRRVSRRLGGDGGGLTDDLPQKPKWMRRATYEALLEKAWSAEEVIDEAFCGWADRFLEGRE